MAAPVTQLIKVLNPRCAANGISTTKNVKWHLFICALFLISIQNVYAVAFTDTFDDDLGDDITSFNSTLGGVEFTYAFSNSGDRGIFGWDGGLMTALSSDVNPGTTEYFSISRSGGAAGTDFTFNSIHVENLSPVGGTVTVQGYLDGSPTGSPQQVISSSTNTLDFGGLRVDEVRITSNDFDFVYFDNFAGDTDPPNTNPTITSATASI